ncbi:CHASE2 domain-containing protein [Stenotrophomonas rhizophila]|uniref:CHASE2 domain-containing protein n=1 Tax=Stenotrophomonas rhizophila TaxID=216778 RepID=UPI001E64600D|nr:CHASE2 domain-containing protein [Stenotrophomonas rhizophila]MCC7632787.1 CHASE2 domain-containing protein [Stenotrophomonas rhizophila]MCC7662488.1 CHASE2 domain-containing protein [Stenotrophomonas rhizophila]
MKPRALPWLQRIAVALLFGALAAAASHWHWFWQQDEAVYDAYVGRWDYPPDPRLLIVAIDDNSLQQIGQWPWPRSTHARLLDRLTQAGSTRVVLDLMLSEPDRQDNAQDAELAAAIRRNGHVVLPVLAAPASGPRMAEELLPIPLITANAATLGHSDVEVDADGVARGLYLTAGIGSPHWPALGLALADRHGPMPGLRDPQPDQASPYQWRRDHYVRVRYAGPPERFPQVSYVDVLDGKVDAAMLRGRLVLVGMTASGIAPRLLTPTSRERWMSGSEYQANVASMLLGDKVITLLPTYWQDLLSGVLVALCCLGLTLPRAAASALLALPLTLLLSFVLLRAGNLWFAPAAALTAMLAAILAWVLCRISAWRRQANSDALTGLGNRLRFEQALQQEHDAGRRSGRPLSLVLIDVDHFKHHNDIYGHHAGDNVLRQIASAIGAHARRPRDMAARFGGDEFALILPDTAADGAALVVEDLLACARGMEVPASPGDTTRITLTVGVFTRVPGAHTEPHHFFEGADAALYRAKAAGRNGYVTDDGADAG